MDIIIHAIDFTASENLENFIREKAAKLFQHDESIIRADVTLKKDHATTDGACVCEIRLEIPGNDDFVKKTAEEYEIAITEATDTLLNVIHKRKSKLNERRADLSEIPEDISTDF